MKMVRDHMLLVAITMIGEEMIIEGEEMAGMEIIDVMMNEEMKNVGMMEEGSMIVDMMNEDLKIAAITAAEEDVMKITVARS